MNRNRNGYTLIEVMVSLAVFGVLIAMAFQISMFTTRAATEKITIATLEVKGERTLKLMVEALTPSAQLGVDLATVDPDGSSQGPNGTGLTYYTPIDTDLSGTVLIGGTGPTKGMLEYGVSTEVGQSAGTMRFEYMPTLNVLDEANEVLDMNMDGDMTDQFEMGYIQRTTSLLGDMPQVVGVANIIQRLGSNERGKSIMTDSTPGDRTGMIFYLPTGTRVLKINLYLMSISEDRIPHLIQCKGQVFLRNQ